MLINYKKRVLMKKTGAIVVIDFYPAFYFID